MNVGLVSAPFSRQMPPSIPSVKLASWYATLKDQTIDVKVFDLNSDLFLNLKFNDEAYNLLHHFFGGLVYIPLKHLPSNEFYFDTNTAVPLLLTLAYSRDDTVDHLIKEKSRDFKIESDLLSSWVSKTVDVIDSFSQKIAQTCDIVCIDMPMPGASTSGLLLGKYIKDMNSDTTIVAAGNHINIPELALLGFSMNAYDYVAFWDDEYTVGALSALEEGTYEDVPNIVWKEGNNLKRSKKVVMNKNLDVLPVPDFSAFNLSTYKVGALGARAVLIETARSCPYRCNYCSFRKFWNCLGEVTEVYRSKSVERIIAEIEAAQKVYPVNCISFGDRTLNYNGKKRFERLLSQLKGRNLIYAGAMRVDLLTDSLIEEMAEAGFVSVVLGIESFDTVCIRSYEKGSGGYVKNAVDAALRLLENGIMPHINILVGHPRESCEDTMRALEALEKVTETIKKEGYPVSGLNSSVFHFNYPSKMYDEFLESDNFQVVYHDVKEIKGVPDAVKRAAERIPLKAVRKEDAETVDKCMVSDRIYTFWSDDEEIIAYTLRILENYFEPLFDVWMLENIVLVWEGSVELGPVTTEAERVVQTIIDASQLDLRQLVQQLGYDPGDIPKEVKKMLWATIFMLYNKKVLNILPSAE